MIDFLLYFTSIIKKNFLFFSTMNLGQKIFTAGVFVFAFGLSSYFFLPFLQNLLPKETTQAPLLENNTKNEGEKIPQKVNNTTEKISGEFYIDFQCPHCREFYKTTLAPLKKEYSESIDISVAMYPQRNTGLSLEIAKYFVCAKAHKDSFDLLDFFLFGKDEIPELDIESWNTELEFTPEEILEINSCLETAEEKVLSEKTKAQEKGVRGTPTFFIGEKKFEGSVSKALLELEILRQEKK